ncbi:MAG: sigma-54 dependent transcriptional regulator [Planctomycetaceae bacterium]|nr:sigma-54 dependent transcriptional regulator [Planctomycetaceae bacterium]
MTQAHPDIIPFPGRPAPAEAATAVLIVGTDPGQTQSWLSGIQAQGYSTRCASSIESAVQWLQAAAPDVCVVGTLANGDSLDMLQAAITKAGLGTQIVRLDPTEPGRFRCEWLADAVAEEQLPVLAAAAVQRSQLQGEVRRLRRQLCNRNLRDMAGHSPAMQQLRTRIQQLAELSSSVLIFGEPGCGADVVAQAIHDASKRAHRPFVSLDCSVHSAETLEQELFGVADSSAGQTTVKQPGRLELADGGTLLLDNVDCIALPLQRRLAAVLQDQRYEREGTGDRVRFDVRVILATHADLDDLLKRGLFRAELHRDAAQQRLDLPPLRTRPEDIAPLAETCLRKIACKEGRPPRSLTLDALHRLQTYHWPSNFRELEHVIERACTIDTGRKLTATMIEPWLANTTEDEPPAGLTLEAMERQLIEATFARFAGNRERTAKALQIGIRTLSGKLREYGYPPRGGPGSNAQPWTPTVVYEDDLPGQKAA